jgi:hypothetical protein
MALAFTFAGKSCGGTVEPFLEAVREKAKDLYLLLLCLIRQETSIKHLPLTNCWPGNYSQGIRWFGWIQLSCNLSKSYRFQPYEITHHNRH